MPVKNLVKEMEGIGNVPSRRKGWGRSQCRGKSHIAPEGFPPLPPSVQQSRWADIPPELLVDIIGRVEASQTYWPTRKDVVACASVCRSWRSITKEIVRSPERCGFLTFPISLKQPGPRDSPIQCFIRREKASSTFGLFIGRNPGDVSKILLVARKIRRATSTEFTVSLVANEFSRTSKFYIGKLRSDFLGRKFTIYDSQHQRTHPIPVPARARARRYNAANISYELNLLRTRGPRRMQCVLSSIPFSAIQEGGAAPTPSEFTTRLGEQSDPLRVSKAKYPLIKKPSSATLPGPLESIHGVIDPLVLKNKAPRWHEQLQCWCLNFKGRVTVASVKNFQLVAAIEPHQTVPASEHDRVILQFGKIGKDIFTMDYCYPLSAFKAFAICLSSFDTKPACE